MKTFSRKHLAKRLIRLDNFFWILLALSITAVYVSISTGKIAKWNFYNPDALYLPMFYKDLFSNHSILGWKHPPATSFFPDMPLYIILNFLVRNFHLAIMVFGIVQSLLFIVGMMLLSNAIFGYRRSLHALILLVGTIFFLFLATGKCNAFLPILQNGYHFGATLSLVLSLLLTVQILRSRENNKKAILYAGLLFLVSVLTLLSDAIYMVQFLIPVMLSILLLFFFSMISAKHTLFTYIALIPTIPISIHFIKILLIFRNVQHHTTPSVGETIEKVSRAVNYILHWSEKAWCSHTFLPFFWIVWIAFALVGILLLILSIKGAVIHNKTHNTRRIKGLRLLLTVVLFTFSLMTTTVFAFTWQREWLVWIVFVLVSTLLLLLTLSTKKQGIPPIKRNIQDTKLMFIISFFVFCIIINIVATLSNGGSEPRYFLPAIIVPLFFGWPFLFGGYKKALTIIDNKYVMYVLVAGTLLLFLLLDILPNFRNLSALSQLSDYYPEFVECLDKNTRARNIRNGIAQYWRAKYITMLSKNNLHVVQAVHAPYEMRGLIPEHQINNLNWYNHDFEFVIADPVIGTPRKIDEGKIIEDFGEPADVFSCDNKNILVYNRKQDMAFQKQFRKYFSFDFYALQLPSDTGRLFGLSRITEESSKKGFLTYGPYVELFIGDYYFEIHYYAKSNGERKDVGKWDIITHTSSEIEKESTKKGLIEGDGSNIISGVFKIRKIGITEIRTYYKGSGTLRIDKITIDRIR
jgi:hypothetical protein